MQVLTGLDCGGTKVPPAAVQTRDTQSHHRDDTMIPGRPRGLPDAEVCP
jgi:hypothetical protein